MDKPQAPALRAKGPGLPHPHPEGRSRPAHCDPLVQARACVCVRAVSCFSRVQLHATPWTPGSSVHSRQEYWSALPFPSPGDLPNPGIELASPTSAALAEGSLPLAPPGKSRLLPALWSQARPGLVTKAWSPLPGLGDTPHLQMGPAAPPR